MDIFSIGFVVYIASTHSITDASRLLSDSELGSETTSNPDTGIDPYTTLTCNFDRSSFCGWENRNDDFRWELGMGKDSWRRRGRTGVKSGKYIYINSDRGRNRTAYLMSPDFKQTDTACMTFRYHMRGRHIGHLKIYDLRLAPSGLPGEYRFTGQQLRWGVVGQQSIYWQNGKVQIPALDGQMRRQLIIQAFDWAEGKAGNIVLDDIAYVKSDAPCDLTPSWAAPPPVPTVPHTTTPTTVAIQTTDETTELLMFTESANKVPKHITRPELDYMTSTELDGKTSHYRLYESSTVTNETVKLSPTEVTQTFEELATTKTTYVEETPELTTKAPEQTTPSLYMTTKGKRINNMSTIHMEPATPKTGGGVTGGDATADKHKKLIVGIAVGASIGALLLGIGMICFCRRMRRNRKFDYYDNHTVHMTRIAGEEVKSTEGDSQYEKLT